MFFLYSYALLFAGAVTFLGLSTHGLVFNFFTIHHLAVHEYLFILMYVILLFITHCIILKPHACRFRFRFHYYRPHGGITDHRWHFMASRYCCIPPNCKTFTLLWSTTRITNWPLHRQMTTLTFPILGDEKIGLGFVFLGLVTCISRIGIESCVISWRPQIYL